MRQRAAIPVLCLWQEIFTARFNEKSSWGCPQSYFVVERSLNCLEYVRIKNISRHLIE